MSISLLNQDPDQLEYLQEISQRWNIPLIQQTSSEKTVPSNRFFLKLIEGKLQLIDTYPDGPGPLTIDFVTGSSAHRRLYGGGKGQMIAKAVGLNKGFKGNILDATAGLGGDAFVLASLGCQVTLLERSPIIAALLDDALKRGENDTDTSEIIGRMQLIPQDSLEFLKQTEIKPPIHIIYLDPMFPEKKNSALVKKEMQYLQQIIGKDEDSDQLLELAMQHAAYRVVVKRPKSAPHLNNQKPQLELKSKGQRFDIYIRQKLPI